MTRARPRAEELRAAARAVAAGPRAECIPEERLLAFHAGSLGPEECEPIREHLAVCAACVEVGSDARRFLAAMGERTASTARARWQRPLALAAGIALALGTAWLGANLRPRAEGPPAAGTPPPAGPVRVAEAWGDLRVPKAPYLRTGTADDELVFRDESGRGSDADGFARAMKGYERGDFAAAERDLATYLTRRPEDRRAWFYRGVSLLLLGRAKDAVPLLGRAAAGGGPLAGDARFYLALACLQAGDTEGAAVHLRSAADSSPRHRDEARALLGRLGAPAPR